MIQLSASSEVSSARRSFFGSRWPDILLSLLLALLPFLFFWRLITPNPTDRMNIAAGDFTEQYFPLRAFTAQEWVDGRIPLWNPYLYGGQPALADIQSGALYPPHIIEALILGWGGPLFGLEIGFPLWALELQVIVHFSLAAVGTYLFVRYLGLQSGASLRRARFAGVIASLVFTYSGYLTGFPVQQLTILAVSAWLPWVLWGISLASQSVQASSAGTGVILRKSLWPIAWAALAFAMAILAGHPQTVLYIFYLTLAYSLLHGFQTWWRQPRQGRSLLFRPFVNSPWRPLVNWLAIVLLGGAIAAVQLLPTLEFIQHSVRSDLSYQAVSAGLPLNELISIIYPGFFGGSPEYVGIITLVLVALALVLASPRTAVFFWAGAALVGLLLAFGGNTFLYPFFYLLAPGFEAVRQQERAFLVYGFSMAILAGYGALVVAGPLPKSVCQRFIGFERHLRIIAVVALALTAFLIYGSAAATARGDEVNLFYGVLWHHLFGLIILAGTLVLFAFRPRRWLSRPWGMALVAIWVGLNLFTVNWRFNLEGREVDPFTPNGVVQFLQDSLVTDRAVTPNSIQFEPTGPISLARVSSGGFLPGGNSAASVYNLQDLTGNTPLQLATVNEFMQQMPSWRMWQLMNVRYVVDERDISGNGLSMVFEEDDLKVFEMGDPFPRSWFVWETEHIPGSNQAIARLGSDDFNLQQAAIVAEPLNIPLAEASSSTVKVIGLSPTKLTAAVDATGHHLLVLSQIYYPGWEAAIDNRPVDLIQVNLVQQGVVVPPGAHLIEVRFVSSSFWWGILISLVGAIVWAIFIFWSQK